MQYVTFSIVFLHMLNVACSRDALEYFVQKKHVKNSTVTVLGDALGNSSRQWIEYKYHFAQALDDAEASAMKLLTVGVLLQEGHEFDCRIADDTNDTQFMGYSVDVVRWLQSSLNLNLEFLAVNSSEILEKSLLSNEIDLAICHPTIQETVEIIELYPSLKGSHLLVYKPSKLHFTKDIFILTFAGWLYLVFFILLILLAICLRITTTKYSMIHPKYEQWTWVEITLWAIAAACQQGLSHTPCGFASCCIFFMGYLIAYLLYTVFAAAITSLLLQHDIYYKLDVSTLSEQKFQLVCFSDTSYRIRGLQEKFVSTTYVNNLHYLFDYLNEDNTVGLAPEILVHEYMTTQLKNEQISTFLALKLLNFRYHKSFYVPRNSTWKKLINRQLLKMDETGILQNMLKRNLNPSPMPDMSSGYSSAGREHVGSAVLIWLAGVLFAVAFLLAEWVLALYKRHHNTLNL